MKKCTIPGCDNKHNARGLCGQHYREAKREGNLPKIESLDDRMNKYSFINSETGCIEWSGFKNHDGCGRISVGKRMEMAHRVSWESKNGTIPDGIQVLHKCDNRCCINPDHLFLGTQLDNMVDMNLKGRQVTQRGESSWHAKLTESDVRKIRNDPRTTKQIAAVYGVGFASISKIKTRKTWNHIS